MKFPNAFAARFPWRQLLPSNSSSALWLVADGAAKRLVLKTTDISRRPAPEVLESLAELQGLNIVTPIECLAEGNQFHQLFEYFPNGSLEAHIKTSGALSPSECEELLKQIGNILARLHAVNSSDWIIHRDIKPSNIFLGEELQGNRSFYLADFDAAIKQDRFPRISAADHYRRYTVNYAAPEIIGDGVASAASDWWSLGMVLLESLVGTHPLVDKDSKEIRRLLSTSWTPTTLAFDQYWRALFGGLFDRNPESRWDFQKVSRWLQREPSAISEGLVKAGETSTQLSFLIGDIPAYSAKGLAEALLRRWEPIR